MATNNNNKALNVPHLRFPEFTGEWKTKLINDLAVVIGGGTPDTTIKSYWDGEIQWFTPSEIGKNKYVDSSLRTITEEGLNNSSAKLLPPNTILLSSRATIGECSLSLRECATNQGFQSLVSKKCNVDFLYYLIQTKKKDLIRKSCGSTFLEISANEVRKIQVSVPADVEQQKIAGLLSLIDDRITTQNKIIEDLEKLKSAIRERLYMQIQKGGFEHKTIRDVLSYEHPTKYIVVDTEYTDDKELTPVLTANKTFILGYTPEQENIYRKGDCIIFDDFTMNIKFVSSPFKIKSSAIKILTARSNVNLYFIYEYLLFLNLISEEHKRHYISEIEPLHIVVPGLVIQHKIADILQCIDKQIYNAQQLQFAYQRQKQYLLNQMFI